MPPSPYGDESGLRGTTPVDSVSWWTWRELNPRPPARQAGALPLSYRPNAIRFSHVTCGRRPTYHRKPKKPGRVPSFPVGQSDCSRTSSAGRAGTGFASAAGSLRRCQAYYFRSSRTDSSHYSDLREQPSTQQQVMDNRANVSLRLQPPMAQAGLGLPGSVIRRRADGQPCMVARTIGSATARG